MGLASAGRATERESEEEVWTIAPQSRFSSPSDPLWSLVAPPSEEFPPVDKLTRRAGDTGILPDFGSLFQQVSPKNNTFPPKGIVPLHLDVDLLYV